MVTHGNPVHSRTRKRTGVDRRHDEPNRGRMGDMDTSPNGLGHKPDPRDRWKHPRSMGPSSKDCDGPRSNHVWHRRNSSRIWRLLHQQPSNRPKWWQHPRGRMDYLRRNISMANRSATTGHFQQVPPHVRRHLYHEHHALGMGHQRSDLVFVHLRGRVMKLPVAIVALTAALIWWIFA
jgi:hypothetical protein